MNDANLLLPRVASGDQEAVKACWERYGSLVWSLARRFTANQTDAEDAVQEIFIELWSHASRFDESKGSETTFVAMLARRRLIDGLRRTKRRPREEDLSEAANIQHPDQVLDVTVKEDAARAARLIRSLKPEQQRVIQLAVREGLTHQDIAETLQMPLGTVKTHLRRGLLKVRAAMEAGRGPGRAERGV